jgi:glycolate oxidase FAD binding subunit
MNMPLNRLAAKLEAEVGAEFVAREPARRSMDGAASALLCSPETPGQVAALLRVCAEAQAAVRPWGGRTGANVGNARSEPCVAIELTRLNRVIEHDHANLTITVESGITLAAVGDALSLRQQFLPVDAPHPAKATIGGTIALNINGPRRGYYGGIRDLVIGMKVALITGQSIKAGGKVVKNVAGYDMCKLFTGSLGTLGVITETTVRVTPVPVATATIVASGNLEAVVRLVDRLSESALLPAAMTLMRLQPPSGSTMEWQVALWCEGLTEHVERHLSDIEILGGKLGVGTALVRGDGHETLWDSVRDFPLDPERCVYRVMLPRAAVVNFIEDLSRVVDTTPRVVGDMVMGALWLSWPAHSQTGIWPHVTSLAATHRGHAVMFTAPHGIREGYDVWGPPSASLKLMRKIKQEFDPDNLLNPGRFIAGI